MHIQPGSSGTATIFEGSWFFEHFGLAYETVARVPAMRGLCFDRRRDFPIALTLYRVAL